MFDDRRPFLLLDPPSTGGFWRRAVLREKDFARAAAFPSIDLILLSGAVRQAGYRPVFIDAQLDRLGWQGLIHRLRLLAPAGLVSLTSSSRIDEELANLARVKDALPELRCFIVGTIIVQQDGGRIRRLLETHAWLEGIILNTAEHNLGELITPGASAAPFNIARRGSPACVAAKIASLQQVALPVRSSASPARAVTAGGNEDARYDAEDTAPILRPGAPDGVGGDTGPGLDMASPLLVPEVRVRYGDSLRIPRPEHGIFKDPRYSFPQSKRGPVTCVQFSFGCPFTCEFCVDNLQYRKLLHRQVDDVVEELSEIERLGFREVYFKDLTFGLSARHAEDLLHKIIERRLRLRWLCTTRIDVARPELLRLMKQAGCFGIEFGIEHYNERVRHRLDKRISEERIRAVFADCRRLGLETTAFIMLAFEDDTEEDVRRTIRFARSLGADYASFNVVNALPGTALEQRARREGFLLEQPTDYSFATSNIRHRHLTSDQIRRLYREAVRSFYLRPSMIFRRLRRVRSVHELRKMIRLGSDIVLGA
ncbi:MAG: radical SAM protein [Planctomycetes bacterium]|nr:radical SAM protein [Planctomycetota bacterium]